MSQPRREPLREPLEHLHTELGNADPDASNESLEALKRDTETTLEHPDPHVAVAEDPSYRTRLEETVERFEASHPGVTRAARNVLEVLTANGL